MAHFCVIPTLHDKSNIYKWICESAEAVGVS